MSEQQSGEKLWAFCNVGVANSITYRAVCVLNWENIHSKTAVIIIPSRNMFTFSYLCNPFLAPKPVSETITLSPGHSDLVECRN